MKLRWATQNEALDADGFLLEGAASFVAEMECLREAGCPDTEAAALVSVEVVGRDESITTAEVSEAMARWLFNETDAEAVEEADGVGSKLELAALKLEENREVEGNSKLVDEALAIILEVIAAGGRTGAV